MKNNYLLLPEFQGLCNHVSIFGEVTGKQRVGIMLCVSIIPEKGKSQFTISQAELRTVLQSPEVVRSPIVRVVVQRDGVRYFREVDMKRPMGLDRFNNNDITSVITVLTDKRGSLITVTPGVMK